MNAVKIALLQLLAAKAEALAARLKQHPQMRTEDFARNTGELAATLANIDHHNALQARAKGT